MRKAVLFFFILALGGLSGCLDFLKEEEDDFTISMDYDGTYSGVALQSGFQIGQWEMTIEDGQVNGYYYDGVEWTNFFGAAYNGGILDFGLTLNDGTRVDVSIVIDEQRNVNGSWTNSDDESGVITGGTDGTAGPGPGTGSSNSCSLISFTGEVDGELGATGEISMNCEYSHDGLTVSSLTLKYQLGILFGEVTRKAVFKWEGQGSLYDVYWGAAVLDAQGNHLAVGGKPLYMSWEEGTFEGPGEGFGWDVSGSPSWSDVFLFYNEAEGTFYQGVDQTTAKSIYQSDFILGQMIVLELNDVPLNQ